MPRHAGNILVKLLYCCCCCCCCCCAQPQLVSHDIDGQSFRGFPPNAQGLVGGGGGEEEEEEEGKEKSIIKDLKRHAQAAVTWTRCRLAPEIGGAPCPSDAASFSQVRHLCRTTKMQYILFVGNKRQGVPAW